MARLLTTDVAQGAHRLKNILGEKHRLVCANNVEHATSLAKTSEPFNLIIVGLLFDDSRMFDLMKAVKEEAQLAGTPAMGFSDQPAAISVAGREDLETSKHLVGACNYVDTQNMSDEEIAQRIDVCLTKARGVRRLMQRRLKNEKSKKISTG
jgi:PleD family two-component response regulator